MTLDPTLVTLASAAAETGGGSGYTIGFSLLGAFGVGILVYALIFKNFGLIVGASVALVFHFGMLYGSDLLDFSFGEKQQEEEEVVVVSLIEMPEVVRAEEPEPEIVESDSAEEVPLEFAPPQLADVPSAVSTGDIVQKLAPPPPPDTAISRSTVTIPVNRQPPRTNMSNLFDLKDLDQIPQAISQVAPQFPYELKRQGVTGRCEVGFIVDSKGQVRDAYVISSSHTEFEQPSLLAVQKWRFRPGKKGGKSVNTRMKQLFTFTLNAGD